MNHSLLKFTALIQGGLGPDAWDQEVEIDAENITDAVQQAVGKAADAGGQVVSIEQNP
jgi:hypothetical protein